MQANHMAARLRRSMLRNTLAVALLTSAAMEGVNAQEAIRSFDVSAQPAATGLNAFAEQADITLVFSKELVAGVSIQAVKGDYSVSEALDRMLQGTRLSYQVVGDNAIAISDRSAAADGNEIEDAQPDGQQRKQGGAGKKADAHQLETVVVTGTRLRSKSASHVEVMDREAIDRTGASTIRDVLLHVPQVTSVTDESVGGVTVGVNLRGLGFGTTLVLVNGRRAGSSGLGFTGEFFDLNSIPLDMVDRVEVLTEGGSAIYGTDAVAGIVNIILKESLDGAVIGARYGDMAGGNARELRGSIGYGWDSDRFRGMVLVSALDRDPLYTDDRSRTRSWDFRSLGGNDLRTPSSNPANIYSLNGQPLPGLTSTFASVPAGADGVGMTPADFASTAGVLNLTTPRNTLVPEGKRIGAFTTLGLTLSDSVDAFAELAYTDEKKTVDIGQPILSNGRFGSFVVPAINPFNPFGVAVGVDYSFEGMGPLGQSIDNSYARGLFGLRGDIGDPLSWEAAALYARSKTDSETMNSLSSPAIRAALAQSDPSRALNVFRDGPAGSPELLRTLIRPNRHSIVEATTRQVDGFLQGEFGRLPGGPFEYVVGGEWRRESLQRIGIEGATTTQVADGSRDVSAGYAELRIPIVGPESGEGIHSLDARVAARYDDYSDFGGTFNPQVTLDFSPIKQVTLHAAYSTSFRAPNVFRISEIARVTPGSFLFDPRRNETVPVDLIFGGEAPGLGPEKGKSLTVGMRLQPFEQRLNFGLDYWKLKLTDAIIQVSTITALANEASFPELITRAQPTAEDIAAGRPGRLLALQLVSVNFGKIETNGIDFRGNAVFDTRLGRFLPFLNVTYIDSFKAAVVPGSAPVEQVGVAAISPGTIVRWKGNAGTSFERDGWAGAVTARYIDGYRDASFLGPANRRVDSQLLWDLRASYDFDLRSKTSHGWMSGMRIAAGVLNVFGDDPPFSLINSLGYDPFQGDIRGRTVYLELNKRF